MVGGLVVTSMQTHPCNLHPQEVTPHFYVETLGFTVVYIFLIFALKHRLWKLVGP